MILPNFNDEINKQIEINNDFIKINKKNVEQNSKENTVRSNEINEN